MCCLYMLVIAWLLDKLVVLSNYWLLDKLVVFSNYLEFSTSD
jgi:hypothetical protein